MKALLSVSIWLFLTTFVFALGLDSQLKIQSLEQNLETQVNQELKLFINRPITARVDIKTKQVRTKKKSVSKVKNSLALPGIYDIEEEISFDEVNNEFYVLKTQISQIIVHIDIDDKASNAQMNLARKIASDKAKLQANRGDKVTISKKTFVLHKEKSSTQEPLNFDKTDKKISNLQKELSLLFQDLNQSKQDYQKGFLLSQKRYEKHIKDINKSHLLRLNKLEKESKQRLAQLDKNDILLLSKLDKEDIKRIESLISKDKNRLLSLKKKTDDALVKLSQTLNQALQKQNDRYVENQKNIKKEISRLQKSSKPQTNQQQEAVKYQVDDSAVEALRLQTKQVIDTLLLDINSNFALLQAQIRSAQATVSPVVKTVTESPSLDKQALLLMQHQFDAKIKALESELKNAKKDTKTWLIMLAVIMLSLGYILYYFNANSTERIEEELEDSMQSISNAIQSKRQY